MSALSLSSLHRRERVEHIARIVEAPWGDMAVPPSQYAHILQKHFAPTTALTYFQTIRAIRPHWRRFPDFANEAEEAQTILQRQAATSRAKGQIEQANPITPLQLQRLWEPSFVRASTLQKIFITMLWISLSRFGDIRHMIFQRNYGPPVAPHSNTSVIRVALPWFKSDPSGKMHSRKAFVIPKTWITLVTKILKDSHRIPSLSYPQIARILKCLDPSLTLHSLRRGGTTFLAETHNAPAEDLQELTLHTKTGSNPSIRLYLDGLDTQMRTQIRLSFLLLQSIL